ncbi:hypothetical protein [Pseudodesulfovibrio sp.]|uniref:hypothetical protein n=1 Tax=unclassified Pseudodesulfovibrio TaxID=2661612 RepID=UPI003AFFEE89
MIDLWAQLDYLRDVQRNFGGMGGRLDMLSVFAKILSFVVPVVVVVALWVYRHVFTFAFLRFFARIFAPHSGKIVENYLVTKGVMLDIYLISNSGEVRKLANARITEVLNGKMRLQLVVAAPTGLKLKNRRVICYCKPFTYNGKRINAFFTLIGSAVKRGSTIKSMTLLTPISYKFVIRRRYSRQQTKEGTVRVKAWDGSKRKTFSMLRPDIQTINDPARYSDKMRLTVENISAGGIRLYILHPKGQLPSLSKGSQLVLRVSVWSPKSKKFTYFNVIGTIRSRFKGKGGAIGLGIQFTAHGEKVGNQFVWKNLQGALKPLAEFLTSIEN